MNKGSRSAVPLAYTIPIIDLDDRSECHVVIDREPGQYLGHPTTVLLEDHRTMIVVYPKGHGRGAIVMKRSEDAGLSWGERLPVPENWATSLEVPTLYRVEDKEGRKRLIMFSGLYPIRMAVSEDDGLRWTPLEPIGDFGGVVAMADLIRLKDGSYMAGFHDRGKYLIANGVEQSWMKVFKCISVDGGLTWSKPEFVTVHKEAHLCEPGFVRSPDGSQIAMLLRENTRQYNSFVTFSDDEGKTWTKPRELPAALTGDRHKLRYSADGRIVAVFRDQAHEGPTWGDFVAWVGRYEDLLSSSEGQCRIRLKDNKRGPDQKMPGADCGYPGLEVLPDGTFIATTYGHWDEGEQPYIISVRFKLADMDSLLEKK